MVALSRSKHSVRGNTDGLERIQLSQPHLPARPKMVILLVLRQFRPFSLHLADTTPGHQYFSDAGNQQSGSFSYEPVPQGADDFIALVPVYMETVIRVAAALVGQADAEDAAQEAMVRGWQAWPTLRERGSVRAWLLRITVNVCKDWQRGRFGTHRYRNESLQETFLASESSGLAMIGLDPGGSDAAMALDLRAVLGSLDVELRTIVALRYYAGMDSSAIGEALSLPAATVRTRLRRALVLLRERLDAQSKPFAAEGGKS